MAFGARDLCWEALKAVGLFPSLCSWSLCSGEIVSELILEQGLLPHLKSRGVLGGRRAAWAHSHGWLWRNQLVASEAGGCWTGSPS